LWLVVVVRAQLGGAAADAWCRHPAGLAATLMT